MKKQSWRKWIMLFACWTLLSLAYFSHLYIYSSAKGETIPWTVGLAESFLDWYVWAALFPLILHLARRFLIGRRKWRYGLLIHFPASLFFSFVQIVIYTIVDQLFIRARFTLHEISQVFSFLLAARFHFGVLTYWVIVGLIHAVEYYKDQEVVASQLETRLALAQLDSLRMQLHPHFLFNTLNSISGLIHQDARAADRMIALLSDLLRMSLAANEKQEVTLKQELGFLEKYLELEQIRFKDRLTVRKVIAPETLNACVPNLILQPLVENSIRHGISRRLGAGLIEIRGERRNEMLYLQVCDDGPGIRADGHAPPREGIGLANTRARLNQLYGLQHCFEFRSAPLGGLQVSLTIPFHTESHWTAEVSRDEKS